MILRVYIIERVITIITSIKRKRRRDLSSKIFKKKYETHNNDNKHKQQQQTTTKNENTLSHRFTTSHTHPHTYHHMMTKWIISIVSLTIIRTILCADPSSFSSSSNNHQLNEDMYCGLKNCYDVLGVRRTRRTFDVKTR